MTTAEVEFLYACEALAAARDASRPDLDLIAALRERVRVTQRAFWDTLDHDEFDAWTADGKIVDPHGDY